MEDPFQNTEKEKELETLVSPIKSHQLPQGDNCGIFDLEDSLLVSKPVLALSSDRSISYEFVPSVDTKAWGKLVNRALKNGNEEDNSFSMNTDSEKSAPVIHSERSRGKKKLIHLDESASEKDFWDEPFIVPSDADKLTSSHRVAPLKIKLDDSMSDVTPSLSKPTSGLSRRNRVPPLEFWKGVYVHMSNSPHITKERMRRIVDRDEERIEEEFEEEIVNRVHTEGNERVSQGSGRVNEETAKRDKESEEVDLENRKVDSDSGSGRVRETRTVETRDTSFLSDSTESQKVSPPAERRPIASLSDTVQQQSISKPKTKRTKKETIPRKSVKPKEPTKSREPKSKPKPRPKEAKSKLKSKPMQESIPIEMPVEEEETHPSPPSMLIQNPWNEEELQQLHDAVETVPLPQTSPLFWTQVSLRIPGKTAEECKVMSLDHGFKPPEKKIPEKPKINKKTEKGLKLARKGTMKRKRQLREMMEELDEKEESKDKGTIFDTQQINGDWESAFRVKTPAISRKRGEPLNTSVMSRSFDFEDLNEMERDRIIVEAEKNRKKVKVKKTSGLPQAKKTIASIEECKRGTVSGYINKDGVPVVHVSKKSAIVDFDEQLQESMLSEDDSL